MLVFENMHQNKGLTALNHIKTCQVELVWEFSKISKMVVSSRRNACFENMHQNKRLTALKITSNKILLARAHQKSSMIHRWSQKTHGLLKAVLRIVTASLKIGFCGRPNATIHPQFDNKCLDMSGIKLSPSPSIVGWWRILGWLQFHL